MRVDDEQSAAESDKFSSELLTCPNEGCVKMYQTKTIAFRFGKVPIVWSVQDGA